MLEPLLTTWRLRVGLPGAVPAPQGPPRGDLSASKIKLLDRCPLAYSFDYVQKLDDRPTDALLRGGLVHRVLAAVARPRVGAVGATRPTRDELRAALRVQGVNYATRILAAAQEILDDQADRLDFANTFAVEENWKIDLPQDALAGPAFRAVGSYDRLDAVESDPETGVPTVILHDYKSGAFVQSVGELCQDPQVQLYVAAIRHGGWAGPIRVTFHYLGADLPTTFIAPADLAQRGLDLLMTKMAELRDRTVRSKWEPSIGPHCVGCDFRDRCSAYQDELRTAANGTNDFAPAGSDAELLTGYNRCRMLHRLFEEHKGQYGEALRARLAVSESDRVIGGGLRAILVARPKTKLPEDPETVGQVVAAAAGLQAEAVTTEISGVSERKLKALVDRLPAEVRTQVKAALDNLRETYDVTPSLDVRRLSGGF